MLLFLKDDSWMLPCMSKQLFGMDCPGCGIQRSISHLIHGEFIDAFFMYPGIYPLIFLFSFLALDLFKPLKHGEQIKFWLAMFTISTIVLSYVLKTFVLPNL